MVCIAKTALGSVLQRSIERLARESRNAAFGKRTHATVSKGGFFGIFLCFRDAPSWLRIRLTIEVQCEPLQGPRTCDVCSTRAVDQPAAGRARRNACTRKSVPGQAHRSSLTNLLPCIY